MKEKWKLGLSTPLANRIASTSSRFGGAVTISGKESGEAEKTGAEVAAGNRKIDVQEDKEKEEKDTISEEAKRKERGETETEEAEAATVPDKVEEGSGKDDKDRMGKGAKERGEAEKTGRGCGRQQED